jgi:hypothetical protein
LTRPAAGSPGVGAGHVSAARRRVIRLPEGSRRLPRVGQVPWESSSTAGGGSVKFVFYATDDQAQEILAEVSTQGFSEVRLFKSAGDDGRPIDGSTVIKQFHIEQNFPKAEPGEVHRLFRDCNGVFSAQDCVFCMTLAIALLRQ